MNRMPPVSLLMTFRMNHRYFPCVSSLRFSFHGTSLISRAFSSSKREIWHKENGYTIQTIPNPFTNKPALVGRPNVSQTNICDPDNILSTDTKDVLEGCLNELSNAKLAKGVVAIVNKVASTDKYKLVEGGKVTASTIT